MEGALIPKTKLTGEGKIKANLFFIQFKLVQQKSNYPDFSELNNK